MRLSAIAALSLVAVTIGGAHAATDENALKEDLAACEAHVDKLRLKVEEADRWQRFGAAVTVILGAAGTVIGGLGLKKSEARPYAVGVTFLATISAGLIDKVLPEKEEPTRRHDLAAAHRDQARKDLRQLGELSPQERATTRKHIFARLSDCLSNAPPGTVTRPSDGGTEIDDRGTGKAPERVPFNP